MIAAHQATHEQHQAQKRGDSDCDIRHDVLLLHSSCAALARQRSTWLLYYGWEVGREAGIDGGNGLGDLR